MAISKLALIGGLMTVAFLVSTIVLAVLKVEADNELGACDVEKNELLASCETAPGVTTLAPITTTTTTTAPATGPPAVTINYRLYPNVIPTLYTLHLNPDLNTQLFSGYNNVNLRITERTNQIRIHSNGLTINSVTLLQGTTTIPSSYEMVLAEEVVKITLGQFAEAGDNYQLQINFAGDLRNRIVGLYSSTYTNELGTQTRIATSKFEPTYARQAFPCFDEPAMKAPFKISLVRPNTIGYSALSNMNEESTSDGPTADTSIVHFAQSVPMSTYLACFIVSDFVQHSVVINAAVGNNFDLRVFATRAQIAKADYARLVGQRITEYYIDYFQVAYPLPKLDMAAIPDFVSGAMEHWGLVTFRETSLLYDPYTSSTVNKQRVAEVVAHELAHMWFGNLVTMAWWDELWLNEGFASYIEFKGIAASEPSWNIMDEFAYSTTQAVLALDATLASHPIVQTANSPDEITELFDTITYSKGAAIIRMLEDFVGPAVFKQGVTNYLLKFQYSNAVTEDLLNEIEALVTDIDVKYIMSTWTKQMGFPLVTVEPVSVTQYKLTQTRMFSNPDNAKQAYNDSEFNYRWYVPITYTTSSAPTTVQRAWFKNEDIEIVLPDVGVHDWIKLNKDQTGYYRVNYPESMWLSITNALIQNINTFSVADRAHLLNDAFQLADATIIKYETALKLTEYLAFETHYVPWSVASSEINKIRSILYYTSYYGKFVTYGQSIIADAYNKTNWMVGNDFVENKLRISVLGLACAMGVPACLEAVGEEFTKWIANPEVRPSPDLRSLIYSYGMQARGTEATWNVVWDLYLKETDAQEQTKLRTALSDVQVPWLLKRFVDLAWDENNVRGQDYFTCLQNIAGNRVGEAIVWDYVRDNWLKLVDRFGLNERYLGRMIPSITGRFNSQIKLQEVQDFFAKYPEAGAGAAARVQTIENIQNKIDWLENNLSDIGGWLDANY